jgi:hypothetical protein
LSYREVQFIGEPIAARFPPGYPALLALCSTLFGERLNVIALVGILFSVSGIWALFDVVRRRWSTSVALVVATLVAINPALLEFVSKPLTEIVFTSLALWTLWFADRMDTVATADGVYQRTQRRSEIAAIALAVLTAMTRTAGATLPLSLFIHWAWRRRWREAATVALAATVFVGGWLAWTSLAPRREVRMSYIDDAVRPTGDTPSLAGTIATRLASNVPAYVTQVSLTLVPVPVTRRTILDNVGWVLVLGTCFLVGWFAAWKRWHAAAVYMGVYCGLLAVWPYLLDRFLVPVIPLALAFVVIGAATLATRMGRWRDVPVVSLSALLAFFALRADTDLVIKASDCDRTRVDCAQPISLDYVDASRLAATITPPTARFIAPKAGTLYLHGGRQSVFWEEVVRQDTASFLPYVRQNGVTHVLLSPIYADYETVLRLVEHDCMRFAIVHSFSPHTAIFAFRDSAATAAEGERACAFVRRAIATAHVVVSASSADVGDDGISLGAAVVPRAAESRSRETVDARPAQVRYVHTGDAGARLAPVGLPFEPHGGPSTGRSSTIRIGHASANTTRAVAPTKQRHLLSPEHGPNQPDHAG